MRSLPRRHFLALAGAVTLGTTGCQVSDPVIRGGPSAPPPTPSPTPTPEPVLPGQQAALRHEAELAALASQVRDAAERLRLGSGSTAVAGWMAEAHGLHVTALLNSDPVQRATTAPTPGGEPRPSPSAALTARTRDQAVEELRLRLESALGDYRRAAIGGQGPATLLWGSLAAYARSAQTALGRDVARPQPPAVPVRPLEPWSDGEAEQQSLRQVHGLVYGYQVAIPWLPRPENQRAYDLLVERRALRDRLAHALRERGLAAPAAEPAYALPQQPTGRSSAAEMLWRMESAFTPFAGAWLATATDPEARRRALASLEQTTVLCVEWGGPLAVWPGWPL